MPHGTYISVPENQDGKSPTLVDSAHKLPVQSGFGDLQIDAWGAPVVSSPKSLVHALWTFDIPASQWLVYEDGAEVYSGAVNVVSENSALKVIGDATHNVAEIVSRQCPRYQPNRGHLFSTAVWMPNKLNDGVREFGLRTLENGVFFRLKSDGLLYAVLVSGGVETHDELIDVSCLDCFDVEKGNVYDINYQWRGVGNYNFFVNLKLVHTFSLLGSLTALSMENPALPISYKATRNTQDVAIYAGCADVTSQNGETDKEVYGSGFAESVTVSTDTPVIVIHQPLLIDGQTNTRTISLARVTVNSSKKGTFSMYLTRVPSAIVGATFKPIGGGSFVETDSPDVTPGAVRATSVVPALMRKRYSLYVEALVSQSSENPYRGRIEFPIVRGDYLVVTGSGASASADVVVEWGEAV